MTQRSLAVVVAVTFIFTYQSGSVAQSVQPETSAALRAKVTALQKEIDELKRDYATLLATCRSASSPQQQPAPRPESIPAPGGQSFQEIVKAHCAKEWPTDFRMQAHCQDQQQTAMLNIGQRNMRDTAEHRTIRAECVKQWGTDFRMVDYCEQQQLKALDDLRRR